MAQASLTKAIKAALLAERDAIIRDVAYSAINLSPVDTGAYVTSFSVRLNPSAGRSRSSHGKPRGQSASAKKDEAKSQIDSDIAGLPDDADKIYITNHAPHARYVEGRGNAPMSHARQMAGIASMGRKLGGTWQY